MARLSTVEAHPDRVLIDGELRNGVSCTVVARAYGLSRQAVDRHKHRHITKAEQQPGTDRDMILQQVRSLYNATAGLVKTAREQNNPTKFLSAVKEARSCLSLLAKCIGMLETVPQVQVNTNVQVDVSQLKQMIVDALQPYPDARQAVAGALLEHAEAERAEASEQ